MSDAHTFVPHVSDRTESRIEIDLGHGRVAAFTGGDLDRPAWVVCLHDDGPDGPTWRTVGAPARSKSAAASLVRKIENGAHRWGSNAPTKLLDVSIVSVPAFDLSSSSPSTTTSGRSSG